MKLSILIIASVMLTGCASSLSSTVGSSPTVQQKAVNTTLTGTITKAGGKFYISSVGQATKELDSYTVKLDDYVGKKVSVTGQYSGITLFVDTVSE